MKPTLVIAILAVFSLVAAACGDGESNSNPDGPPLAGVQLVACPASPAATFLTEASRFNPMTATVDVGDIVKFDTTTGHDVRSDTAGLFNVPIGQDRCFRFDLAGTYGFRCEQHGFTGSLVVQ
jgi:hypothetical protein